MKQAHRIFSATLGVIVICCVLLTASTAAWADATTLICDTTSSNAEGPGMVELNEAEGTVTIYSPPGHYPDGQHFPGGLMGKYPATFDSKAIKFVGPQTSSSGGAGEAIVINRLTGIFLQNGSTWTCHVGTKQF